MNKLFSSTILGLILLTVCGFLLRFYQVENNPSILNRDEAALAYNAYLLKETGQDEWGKSWPLALESFGDFKLPGYPLILVAFFNLLPLADWVVRVPSVIAGTLLIPIAYFFARRFELNEKLSLFFTFLIALSPVFFFYSRIAFEANVGLVLFVSSLTLLLSKNKNKLLTDVTALVLFIAAVFTYNTPLLLLPFLVPLIVFSRGPKNWRSWSIPVIGSAVIFIMVMSLLWPLTSQKSGITIFSDESTWRAWIAYRESLPTNVQSSLGSRYVYWLGVMAAHFWQSFTPQFLITEGGTHPWHSLPEYGHLYITSYILGIVGIFQMLLHSLYLLYQKRMKGLVEIKNELILLYLLLVSLAPSVITVDSPHTTRSLFFIFLLGLSAVKGLSVVQRYLKNKVSPAAVLGLVVLLVTVEAAKYFHSYFLRYPTQQQSWQPGFEQVIQEVEQKHPGDQVAVVDGGGFHYILTAWYLKIPADQYLAHNIRQLPDKIGFRYGEQVTHYHFIVSPTDRSHEKALIMWDGNAWRIEP